MIRNSPHNARTYSERRRRTGTGRLRDIFEEKGAASEDEYVRRETARQLKELREELKRRKAEKKDKAEKEEKEKRQKHQDAESTSKNPDEEN